MGIPLHCNQARWGQRIHTRGERTTLTKERTLRPPEGGHPDEMNECRRNHGSFVQAAQIPGEMRMGGGVVGGNETLGCRA